MGIFLVHVIIYTIDPQRGRPGVGGDRGDKAIKMTLSLLQL